ncbi:glycosyltransferase [Candidatus Uhrbacteria bacterium]|nr:glycosyltransferase [Candidatus Uhrbacteria bacterium]
MKICFAGGGSLGPVMPLLAVAEAWKETDPSVDIFWIGTPQGPERKLIEEAGIRLLQLPVTRLTRYPSTEWLFLPFRFVWACYLAFVVLGREKPQAIGMAGGFTGVPVVIAGWLRRIPSWVHQQDATVILSNRLVAPFSRWITVAWERLLTSFPKRKTSFLGNPVRSSMRAGKMDVAYERFGIDLRLPTVLVMGGGGGAGWINDRMEHVGEEIARHANVIHVTGTGKITDKLKTLHPRYHAVELLGADLAHAYAAASIVVCRAGMGTISELAALKKAAILIPLPSSIQEANAELVGGAAMVVQQSGTDGERLKQAILALLDDQPRMKAMGQALQALLPTDGAGKVVEEMRGWG